jgi:hypothetical protein
MPVSISGDGAITGLELEAFEDVDVGSGASDGDVLTYDASGDLWIPQGIVPIAGIGSNVVYTERTTTFTTTSTSFTDWTNVTVTITPTSATSKILVVLTCPSLANSQDSNFLSQAAMRLVRNSTALFGEARTVRGDGNGTQSPLTLVVLDSPATTSATTYKAQVLAQSGTNSFFRGTITVIEVAA